MANDVLITAGSGTTVATEGENGGSRQIQLTKPTFSGQERLTGVKIDISGSGDQDLIAAIGGQVARLYKIFFVTKNAIDFKIKDGAGTDLTGLISLAAGASFTLDFDGEPWFVTSSGNALKINVSVTGQISGRLYKEQH